MQIIAGSFNETFQGFLHAGYISAYPRDFAVMGPHYMDAPATKKPGELSKDQPIQLVDVRKALELSKDAGRISLSTPPAATPCESKATPKLGLIGSDYFSLVLVIVFFAWISRYYRSRVKQGRIRTWNWVLVVVPMGIILYAGFILPTRSSVVESERAAPWSGVPISAYQNPEAATPVIMRGLIAPACLGCSFEVKSLAAIQDQVAFPLKLSECTPGMLYAIRTYGRDGWGREFVVTFPKKNQLMVQSAGPDGRIGTTDDISMILDNPVSSEDWEGFVPGVFVTRLQKQRVVFLHHLAHGLYKPHGEADAKRYTGNQLFDCFPMEELGNSGKIERFAKAVQEADLEGSSPSDAPLFFCPFKTDVSK